MVCDKVRDSLFATRSISYETKVPWRQNHHYSSCLFVLSTVFNILHTSLKYWSYTVSHWRTDEMYLTNFLPERLLHCKVNCRLTVFDCRYVSSPPPRWVRLPCIEYFTRIVVLFNPDKPPVFLDIPTSPQMFLLSTIPYSRLSIRSRSYLPLYLLSYLSSFLCSSFLYSFSRFKSN